MANKITDKKRTDKNLTDKNLTKEFELPNNWEKEMLERYSNGAIDDEIQAWLITECEWFDPETHWQYLLQNNSEFQKVVQKGFTLSKSWWIRSGREGSFKTLQIWRTVMKNYFGFELEDNTDKDNSKKEEIDFSKMNAKELSNYLTSN